ncbi:IS21 family transposase [Brevibacillus centrosporus]|nr:IS21 family transposase [Brevibacillus centrosporus]MEC2132249.1 IS21 family transposase [Brevibacillus centrosporus]
MLAMAQQHYIKYLRDVKDQSISQIADQLGVNWRTARKYADCSDWNKEALPLRGKFPIMEAYCEQVDTWLLEDQTRPKKQRHTSKRIYDRLVSECGFAGSDRTVRYYVAKRKSELQIEKTEPYVRLEHPGGEAQADFGSFQAVQAGKLVERKMLILSYPYSNAAFIFVTPKENTECFLEGLRQLFEMSGGVPNRIWFDNLSAAVVSSGSDGKRKLTEEFQRFALHYRFQPDFCNPGQGNEKGHVENKVGYARRNWCVPLPVANDLDQLQKIINQQAHEDLKRLHYAKGVLQQDLWEQEKTKLLELPTVPYETFRLESVKANGYGEVLMDQKIVKVPFIRSHERVWLKYWWNKVDILNDNYEVLITFPRGYMDESIPIDLQALLQPLQSKPKALDYSSVLAFLPNQTKAFLQSVEGKSRKARIGWILRMLKTYQIEEIEKCLTHENNDDVNHLEHALYRLHHPERIQSPMVDSRTPSVFVGYQPDLTRYDQLQRTEVRK